MAKTTPRRLPTPNRLPTPYRRRPKAWTWAKSRAVPRVAPRKARVYGEMHVKSPGVSLSLPQQTKRVHVLVCPGLSRGPKLDANDKAAFPASTDSYTKVCAAFGRVELTGLTVVLTNTSTSNTAVCRVAVCEENGVLSQEQTIEIGKDATKTLFYRLAPLLERKRITSKPTEPEELLSWTSSGVAAPVVLVT